MSKRTGLIIAGIGLAVVSIFCALTVVGILTWLNSEGSQFRVIGNDIVKATAEETLTIDSAGLTEIVFDLDFSDIEISESDDDQIVLELYKTAWAATEEDAEKNADILTLEQSQRGSKITFSTPKAADMDVISFQNRADTIDIILAVPKDMNISFQVDSGQITAYDYEGQLSIKNKFGSTSVESFTGSLSVESDNGKITLNNLSLDEALSVSSDFGDIFITGVEITDSQTTTFSLESQNGKITLQDITTSGECLLNADFSNIDVDNIECSSLTVESQNGPINLNRGDLSGPLNISTDFGDLTIKDTNAESYTFTALNGEIYANSLQGEVTIDADFGDIELYGQDEVTLHIDSQNGNIFFQGVLAPEAEHAIFSDFGKVEVRIPEDSAFDIQISTDFGEIETDFPLTLSGKLNSSEIEGQINGGGPLLTLESQNGDIILNYLENQSQ